jgi:hypothetical protein
LLYLLNRYYDPLTGQFTSVDPQVSRTLQPYAYADDSPVNLADPTGMNPDCGPQMPIGHHIKDYTMERYPNGSGEYRAAPLYCGKYDRSGKPGWGYRHLQKHIWQVADGTWQEFDAAIADTLEFPLDITDGTSIHHTYDHYGKITECIIVGPVSETEEWGFHVITAVVSAKIISAFSEKKNPIAGCVTN